MTMDPLEAFVSYWWAFVASFALWWVLHPRRGGPKAPPMVLNSPIVNIPYIGMALEFGKSPVKMVRRCFDSYGPVFTVPVRNSVLIWYRSTMLKANTDLVSFPFFF